MEDIDKMDDMPKKQPMLNPRNKRRKLNKHAASKRKGRSRNEHEPSIMECEIATYLALKGIPYVMEKTWPDLKSLLFDELLPVDFWLPVQRAVIEFDGVHHRVRVRGDKSYSLDRRILNDQTRDLFCKQRGFPILRLNGADYKELIDKFLDSIKDGNKGNN